MMSFTRVKKHDRNLLIAYLRYALEDVRHTSEAGGVLLEAVIDQLLRERPDADEGNGCSTQSLQ